MLKTKVKATAITNLTDARYFAAWGTNWLGFDLQQGSDTYVQPQLVHAIKEWVDGVEIVGEFDLEPAPEILTTAKMLGLNVVQLGMFSSVETAIEVQEQYPIIKEVVIEKTTTIKDLTTVLEEFAPYALAFLIDFEKNNIHWDDLKNGLPFDLAPFRSSCADFPILLALPWSNTDTLEEVLTTIRPYGISLKGGVEEKVGYKSFDELDKIFEAIEV